MPTVAELFDLAFKRHQTGAILDAEKLYRKVLQADPAHADAWSGLGAACQAQGKLMEAEADHRRALAISPNHASAHNCLGVLLAQRGQLAEAVAHFRHALSTAPQSAEMHQNLGLALARQGEHEAAIAEFKEAIRWKPHYPEAMKCLADAHSNQGNALERQDKLDEAICSYQQALLLSPDSAEVHNTLGNALLAQGKLEDAAEQYRQAMRLKPKLTEAAANLATALKYQGRFEEALTLYKQTLDRDPGRAEIHLDLGLLQLLLGDWAAGWAEYEWGWQTTAFSRFSFDRPLWDGSPLNRRTLLVQTEQGLGDTLQFIRYVPLVKEHGGLVVVRCQRALAPLLAENLGKENLVEEGAPLPPFDVYAPLLQLPAIFRTTPSNVPAMVPYLHAAPSLVRQWQETLSKSDVRYPVSDVKIASSDIGHRTSDFGRCLRIGIAWQGNPRFTGDRQRSIPVAQFSRLAQVENVEIISLQRGPGTEQLQALATNHRNPRAIDQLDEASGAFMETAAIMKNIDLVITSDSAVAHLAGALGVAVWVALPLVPDWRWLLEREDSPWYPTMRLFRQTRYGQWDDVFDRIGAALTMKSQ
jgi:Tfp pilus assembly protein PilF